MNHYEIRIAEQLDARWSDWFDGFTLTSGTGGVTTITGPVIDQAALHGLLRRVGDLGVTLISITLVDHDADGHSPRRLTPAASLNASD